MKEYYIHIFKNNSVLLSNLPEELREEADRCSCNLTNSMCPIRHVMKRQNKEIITDGYIYMCSYDTSITNKIFLHYFDMLRSVHIAYEEKIKNEKERLMKDLRRLQHNVNTYNATIQDEITNLVPLDDIHNKWKDVVPFVEKMVQENPRLTAITLLKTMKFSTFVTAEMTVHDYINADNIKLEKYSHSMHRIVKLSLQPYFLEFVENNIDIKIGDCYTNIRNLNPQPRKKTGKILVVTARHTKISARIPPCTRVLPPIKPGTNTFQAAHDTDRHISDALRRQPHRSPGYSYGSSPSSYESRFLPITPYR